MSAAAPSALRGFASHELRLAWRDWSWLLRARGGRRHRVVIGAAVVALGLHAIAWAVLTPFFEAGGTMGQRALATVSVSLLLSFTMLLSQAMESVTRAFYARDDLDLILSSPASSRDLFLVRIGMMGLTSWVMSVLMMAPFLNVAAWRGGAGWLAGYAVMLAIALLATGVAVLATLALFRTLGPRRTRLAAQVAAAVVGASFLIGLQVLAVVSYGSMSRLALFEDAALATHAPVLGSAWWLPARALAGDASALAILLGGSAAFFGLAAMTGAVQFRRIVVAAQGAVETTRRQRARAFRVRPPRGALVAKELTLLARDPWLISQTLMQVLYLIPPAAMLWVSFGEEVSVAVLIAPVVVMATGQLAGGLAWLTISGEDAPDLIASAPVSPRLRLTAKVQAVLAIVAMVLLPLVAALALVTLWGAAVMLAGALTAAACAILVQLWFRRQASRTSFRRRQVASKASTIAEALASILCAGTTALVAAGLPGLALVPAVLLVATLLAARRVRPR